MDELSGWEQVALAVFLALVYYIFATVFTSAVAIGIVVALFIFFGWIMGD